MLTLNGINIIHVDLLKLLIIKVYQKGSGI